MIRLGGGLRLILAELGEFLSTNQFLLLLSNAVLLIADCYVVFQFVDTSVIKLKAQFFCSFLNNARRQVHLQGKLLTDLQIIDLGVDDGFCDFLSICFVSSIVFDLYVQIETAFAGIRLVAFGVGAFKDTFDLICTPSIVLFATGEVPLSSRSLEIIIAVVELFNLDDAFEDRVSLLSFVADLGKHLLILEVKTPVQLEIILLTVVLRQFK